MLVRSHVWFESVATLGSVDGWVRGRAREYARAYVHGNARDGVHGRSDSGAPRYARPVAADHDFAGQAQGRSHRVRSSDLELARGVLESRDEVHGAAGRGRTSVEGAEVEAIGDGVQVLGARGGWRQRGHPDLSRGVAATYEGGELHRPRQD